MVARMDDASFGVILHGSDSRASFRQVVARADALGCDVLAAPDHLGTPDPFAVLSAAAQVTDRLKLRTYVLNVGFWNPALLARAAATVDVLSAGRLELGVGAGHMRREHELAELPWSGHRARVQQLERTVIAVRRHLADPDHRPRPVQSQIPIAIGAMTAPGLRIAADHADIVSFAGLLQLPAAPPGTFTIASTAETERRITEVRELANGRPYHSDALLQAVVIGEEPEIAAARLADAFETVARERLLDTPFVLLARDRAHAAELIAERCDRFGFDCFSTHEPYLDALGELIAAYRR
jgi:probable F420-dependent oxidoreductase